MDGSISNIRYNTTPNNTTLIIHVFIVGPNNTTTQGPQQDHYTGDLTRPLHRGPNETSYYTGVLMRQLHRGPNKTTTQGP